MSISIKVGAVPGGAIQNLSVDEGTTISQAVEMAGLSTDGFTVSVNGESTTNGGISVVEGDRVLLTKAIKGNY